MTTGYKLSTQTTDYAVQLRIMCYMQSRDSPHVGCPSTLLTTLVTCMCTAVILYLSLDTKTFDVGAAIYRLLNSLQIGFLCEDLQIALYCALCRVHRFPYCMEHIELILMYNYPVHVHNMPRNSYM